MTFFFSHQLKKLSFSPKKSVLTIDTPTFLPNVSLFLEIESFSKYFLCKIDYSIFPDPSTIPLRKHHDPQPKNLGSRPPKSPGLTPTGLVAEEKPKLGAEEDFRKMNEW